MATDKALIAKNTFMLYLRMILTLVVGLYTSRIVLSILGEVDYGIFNVVGGVIGMLGFLNMSLSASTQRFLNANKEDESGISQQKIFATSVLLHFAVAIIVTIIFETIGLWFVKNKLVIPESQYTAALVVYQVSIISCFLSIINTPYIAVINANEKMGIYAYFSLLDVVLRLVIVFLLLLFERNQLIVYALLCLAVAVIMRIVYYVYCRKHFPECKPLIYFNKALLKKMASFSGWMIWGCFGVILSNQGITVLINIFCGPVFNASRALAGSVQGILYQFSTNILAAAKPQITREYAHHNTQGLQSLVNLTTKVSFVMIFLPSIVIILFTPQILSLWLTEVPPMTAIFIQLLLIDTLLRTLTETIAMVNHAGGKLKYFQLAITILYISTFLLAWIFLKAGFPPYFAYVSVVLSAIIGFWPRLYIIKKINHYNLENFFKESLLPIFRCILCALLFTIPLIIFKLNQTYNWGLIILISIIITLYNVVIIYQIGLSKSEQSKMKNIILSKLKSIYAKYNKDKTKEY